MGRPTGVADSEGAVEVKLSHFAFQIRHSACLLDEAERPALEDRDTGRVIAPVFKALKAFENKRGCFLFSNVADDSAHRFDY